MIIKICGLREEENIKEISLLKPDYMGFIFYPKSPRNAYHMLPETVQRLPSQIKRTGVFVNSTFEEILRIANKYNLHTVQLHGEESTELCGNLKNQGLEVIKAFKIKSSDSNILMSNLLPYKDYVDLFLFDTAGAAPGGNGNKFDWEILSNYNLTKPYLLSGGIGPEDSKALKRGLPPQCLGIDVNSKFEISPGYKNISKLKLFLDSLQ